MTDANGVTTAALLASAHLNSSLKNLDEKGDYVALFCIVFWSETYDSTW